MSRNSTKSKNASSSTAKEDSSSDHNRFWITAAVIICIGGFISLYFDATESTRSSSEHSKKPSYNIPFASKTLPSYYTIQKKAGTLNTFVIKNDGKVVAEVMGGDKTVKINNIIYTLPKLK